jgi:hypothetical protein
LIQSLRFTRATALVTSANSVAMVDGLDESVKLSAATPREMAHAENGQKHTSRSRAGK